MNTICMAADIYTGTLFFVFFSSLLRISFFFFFVSIPDLFLLIFVFTFSQVDYQFTVRVSQLLKHILTFSVENLEFMQKS